MSKITVTGHIVVSSEDLAAVLRELPVHIDRTRREPGCLVFEVAQDRDDPRIFTVYEEFVDRSSFEFHQERVWGSTWAQVSAKVERHYNLTGGSGEV